MYMNGLTHVLSFLIGKKKAFGFQSRALRPATSASSDNMLKMHSYSLPQPTESETLRWEPANYIIIHPPVGLCCTLKFENLWVEQAQIFLSVPKFNVSNQVKPFMEHVTNPSKVLYETGHES